MSPRPLTRAAIVGLALATGCQNPLGKPTVASDDPERVIPAIKHDVALHDEQDDPRLVTDLSDPDPAIRFYAIQGLRRLTGDDFGYRYYADEAARAPAVERWRAWIATHGSPVAERDVQ